MGESIKIGAFLLKHKFEADEPQACMRDECDEEFNGLHHFWIEIDKVFFLETWLCDKCAREFRKKLRGGGLR